MHRQLHVLADDAEVESHARVCPRRVRLLVALDRHVQLRNVGAPLAQDLDHVPGRARAGTGEQQLSGGEARGCPRDSRFARER